MDHYEFHPLLTAILGLEICIYQLRNQLRLQRLRQSLIGMYHQSNPNQIRIYIAHFGKHTFNIILSLINWAVIYWWSHNIVLIIALINSFVVAINALSMFINTDAVCEHLNFYDF